MDSRPPLQTHPLHPASPPRTPRRLCRLWSRRAGHHLRHRPLQLPCPRVQVHRPFLRLNRHQRLVRYRSQRRHPLRVASDAASALFTSAARPYEGCIEPRAEEDGSHA